MAQKLFKVILLCEDSAKHTQPEPVNETFARTLRERLQATYNADAEIETHFWSGGNGHGERRLAAGRFRRLLERQSSNLDRFDGYFIAAQGVSGSVARLALNLGPIPVTTPPTGVFTFGASFVRFKPRPIARLATAAIWMLRLLVLLGLALALDAFLLSGPAAASPMPAGRAAAILMAMATPVILVALTVDRLLRRARARLRAAQRRMLERYDPPEREATPYICYHAVFDEAGILMRIWSAFTRLFQITITTSTSALFVILGVSAAVAVAYFVGRAAFGYTNFLESGVDETVLKPLIRAVYAAGGGTPADAQALKAPERLLESLLLTGGCALTLLFGLALIAAPFGVALPRLARSRWIGFGGEPLSWILSSEIRAELAPNPLSEIRMRFLRRAYAEGSTQHDYYLQDEGVIADMAERMVAWRLPHRSLYWRLERFLLALLRLAALLAVLAAMLVVSVAAIDGDWFGLYG